MKKLFFTVLLLLFSTSSGFTKGLALSTGVLDYSDSQKKAGFLEGTYSFGEEKSLETSIGKLIPITGAMLTEDNASMIYAGYKVNYKFGNFLISPSFTPGYYDEGDGKDLGHNLEFKSQVNLGWTVGDKTNFGLSYSHISNASLGDKNPGANNIAFTFYTQY
jgi:lipid A 3-O-deacylase